MDTIKTLPKSDLVVKAPVCHVYKAENCTVLAAKPSELITIALHCSLHYCNRYANIYTGYFLTKLHRQIMRHSTS